MRFLPAALLTSVLGLTMGCAQAPSDPAATGTTSGTTTETTADCVEEATPQTLLAKAEAFDATVKSIRRGDYSDEAAATPLEVELHINEWFAHEGEQPPPDVITRDSWDHRSPQVADGAESDVARGLEVGVRLLSAGAGEMVGSLPTPEGCGFTIAYDDAARDEWRDVFAGEEAVADLSSTDAAGQGALASAAGEVMTEHAEVSGGWYFSEAGGDLVLLFTDRAAGERIVGNLDIDADLAGRVTVREVEFAFTQLHEAYMQVSEAAMSLEGADVTATVSLHERNNRVQAHHSLEATEVAEVAAGLPDGIVDFTGTLEEPVDDAADG